MIYIQSYNDERTRPHHFDCACAMFGAIETARSYRLTSFEELASGKFDAGIRNNLFVGSVEFMREVFKRVGLEDVRLPKNSNRESRLITLQEAHLEAKTHKIFIKPYEIKLFPAVILDGAKYSCLNDIPLDTIVMAYEPFREEIVSEWRVYVGQERIKDSRCYSGDFMLQPDYGYVRKVLNENAGKFGKAYVVDIGILKSGEDVVIEYNDMWAIGNYGVPNDIYLKLLEHRYFEIMQKSY